MSMLAILNKIANTIFKTAPMYGDPITIAFPSRSNPSTELTIFENNQRNAVYEIISIHTALVTDATAGNRRVVIQRKSVNPYATQDTITARHPGQSTGASISNYKTFYPNQPDELQGSSFVVGSCGHRYLYYGDKIDYYVESCFAGDSITVNIRLKKLTY